MDRLFIGQTALVLKSNPTRSACETARFRTLAALPFCPRFTPHVHPAGPDGGPPRFRIARRLDPLRGIDRCVSEFIRITDTVLPERAFKRIVPELANGSRTLAGVPVGGSCWAPTPFCMADNAAKLAGLGSAGVDLNFGCPAKVVNRHGGGAALLQDPDHVGRVVEAVRAAVPAHVPVSAKMRLGFHDDSLAEACAQAIEAAGACELVIHARTKAHGYRPPAYWDRIADIRQHVRLPVIANGEIWSVADALRCQEVTGCQALMIGRGAVSDPGLALAIARANKPHQADREPMLHPAVPWSDLALSFMLSGN